MAWSDFLQTLDLGRWHHCDFDKRRNDYGKLTVDQTIWARGRLCDIFIEAGLFIVGAAIARSVYQKARAAGKWKLPDDPYRFCLERCLEKVIKKVYSAFKDGGVTILYDNQTQYGRISRELIRWHKETFEPNYLSQFKHRLIGFHAVAPLERTMDPLAVVRRNAMSVPDIIAFEACAFTKAATGIPFLGAKLLDQETAEPRPSLGPLSSGCSNLIEFLSL